MLEKIIDSKSKTFLAFCFCFLFGIAFASVLDKKIPFVWIYFVSFIILSFIIIFWSNKLFSFGLIFFAIALLGFVRYQISLPNEIEYQYQIITGYISSEPDVRTDKVNYLIKSDSKDNVGKILLVADLYPRFQYGDRLKLNCDLKKPEPIENFRYDRHLTQMGVFSICFSEKIEPIGSGAGNPILSSIYYLKNKLSEKVSLLWHEPYAGFMAGILYGYRGGLGDLNDKFSITGVSHIVAISGYNISIIASVLVLLLINLYIPRKTAFWIIVFGIITFVILTGASASVVRAGVMGIMVLFAKQLGRVSQMKTVLAFTAAVMCLFNPFILFWNAGFQLSFLATIGIVYVSPLFVIPTRSDNEEEESLFKSLKNASGFARLNIFRKGFFLPALLRKTMQAGVSLGMKECLSAIIITLPLILFQFGRLSIVAVIVNILILWIIPFLMLFGFISILFSFIIFPVGQLLAWFTWAGMKYVVAIVNFFAGLKFAAVEFKINWVVMIIMYIFIGYFVVKKKKDKLLN